MTSQDSTKLILTVPLVYNVFVKPASVVFEPPSSRLHWRPVFSELQQNNPFFVSLYESSKDCAVIDNLPQLRSAVDRVNTRYIDQGIVSIVNEYRCKDEVLSLSIIGKSAHQAEMNSARLELFQSYTRIAKRRISIAADRHPFLFEHGGISQSFCDSLAQIADFCNVCLYVTADVPGKLRINVIAEQNAATMAENRIRLAIDACNPQAFVDFVDIGHVSLLPLIGGTHYFNFKNIVKRTACHLCLPHATPDLFANARKEAATRIYISGIEPQVVIAKHMLNGLLAAVTKSPFVKSVLVMPIKRELLLSMRTDSWLQDIMFETGCFVQVSPYGSAADMSCNGQDVVRFQGNSTELVESAIEKFMLSMTKVYTARYTLKSRPTNILDVQSIDASTSQLFQFTDLVSSLTGTIFSVAYQRQQDGTYCHTFDIVGESAGVLKGVKNLESLANVIPHISLEEEIVYQLELPNKEREFIGGKKNGKILKIMNSVPVSVKIVPFTDYDFFVEIASKTLKDSIAGLQLFEEELPCFDTFNIPESFHRQIIGAGGATIQTIMRRHNVFIKFFNSYEFSDTVEFKNRSNVPQSLIRKNNVVIKCPAKNSAEIPLAKAELEKLVERVAETCHSKAFVKLSRSEWRFLTTLGPSTERQNFVSELEKKHTACIRFPMEEPTSYADLEITGPDSCAINCALQLQSLLPHEYEFKLAPHRDIGILSEVDANAKCLLDSDQSASHKIAHDYLHQIVTPLKLCYGAEVQVLKDPKVAEFGLGSKSTEFGDNVVNIAAPGQLRRSSAAANGEPEYSSLVISFIPSKISPNWVEGSDITSTAGFGDLSGAITNFLRMHKFMIIDKGLKDRKAQIAQLIRKPVDQQKERFNVRNKENLYDHGFGDNGFKPKVQQTFDFKQNHYFQNPIQMPITHQHQQQQQPQQPQQPQQSFQHFAQQPHHSQQLQMPHQPQMFQFDHMKFQSNRIN
ncbi:unnamed protein product [Kuraishia capsulata CBS 1993]|uniref:K Homology domain-containing protein n=1 Tax=Kuraishia capsulata CBS 1993 TaxID=1382522 RepID=W6MJR7_9ASCO|nr:uncharacterized protein KUCA_T00000728001 [Kuraishia capsulata CBS 1993]CDK24762.1 unnamed protein product [Kuraishia capsulata CBS 1993]